MVLEYVRRGWHVPRLDYARLTLSEHSVDAHPPAAEGVNLAADTVLSPTTALSNFGYTFRQVWIRASRADFSRLRQPHTTPILRRKA